MMMMMMMMMIVHSGGGLVCGRLYIERRVIIVDRLKHFPGCRVRLFTQAAVLHNRPVQLNWCF